MEVIIIEDSPPSTPVTNSNSCPISEHAINWSRNTTNFINKTMNSVQHNINEIKPTTNYQPINYVQTNRASIGRNYHNSSHYPQHRAIYPNLYRTVSNSEFRNQYRPAAPNNYWMQFNMNNVPGDGAYYFDSLTQTPIRMVNNIQFPPQQFVDLTPKYPEQNYNESNEYIDPEFIDVNCFMQNRSNIILPTQLPATTKPNRINTNSLPQSSNNTMPVSSLKIINKVLPNITITPAIAPKPIVEEDDDDVIFVAEYKKSLKISDQNKSLTTKSCLTQKPNDVKVETESVSLENKSLTTKSCLTQKLNDVKVETESVSLENNIDNSTNSFSIDTIKLEKNESKSTFMPRRNPKRQVRVERDYLKMIDGAILEADKEESKIKKLTRNTNKIIKKSPINKCYRRSPRIQTSCGATYCPPSPLSSQHLRSWPSEGMHERPEYDPVSGKIEPFDAIIRNISKEFNSKNSNQNTSNTTLSSGVKYMKNTVEGTNKKSLPEICHEMFHHVFAYVATAKKLEKEKSLQIPKADNNKLTFLKDLSLIPAKEIEEKKRVCGILKETVNNLTSSSKNNSAEKDENFGLAELLKNSLLLYCVSNNVSQADVAEYITSLKPEDVIQFSNDQLQLGSDLNDE